jgi:hypothetical protein
MRKTYPSDVTDEEWAFVAPHLTLMTEEAPQRGHSLREVFNGLCSYNTPDNRSKCEGPENGSTIEGLHCAREQPCANQYCTCNTYLCDYNPN